MEASILKSTKKILGLTDDYTAFDLDIITHINAAFVQLSDLGVGPSYGFMIEDDAAVWDDYIRNDNRVNAIKSYIYMKVRMLFDPPQNPHTVTAMEKQIEEMEWRINVRQESTDYVEPGAAPFRVDGQANPIQIQGGIDWWVSFTYKDDVGTPIAVTDVKMELVTATSHPQLLFTTEGQKPGLIVDYSHSPTITVRLPGELTANRGNCEAWFDAYATDPQGNRVQLSAPRFVKINGNVSTL